MKLILRRKMGLPLVLLVLAGTMTLAVGAPRIALATCNPSLQSCSTSYGVNETFFGSGGDLHDCSTSYCAKSSIGELGVGNTASANYQARAGFNTNRTPYLQFIVTGGSTNLGVLATSSTKTTTATFSVKTYLAGGYVVQTVSNPPTSTLPTYPQLHALTTPATSVAGTEQFGMNLVANTSPTTFGANPSQIPSSSFSDGAAASGYNTPNYYKYNKGDTVASSNTSSGETDFTISYIFNISNVTPAGSYSLIQVLVATSTY